MVLWPGQWTSTAASRAGSSTAVWIARNVRSVGEIPHTIEVIGADPIRDAGRIARLIDICRSERRTVLNPYTEEEERAYIESLHPRDAVFVAYIDGVEFAGFAGIARRWSYSERLEHCGEGGTWVMPEYRRMGVGRALWYKGVLPWSRRVGFHHLGFFVMAHNRDAIAFYERLGFRTCGYHRRLVNWDGDLLDAVEMEMWLE